MSGSFLTNQWYVCARSAEVKDAPLGRTVCGEPIVMFRRADGVIRALDDRCPHRKYPLSQGRIVGDEIECGYHGIRFSGEGACTLIPAQADIPRGFGARAYPVLEKFALIYVWIGDPAKADPALLPDFFENASENWAAATDYLPIEANWRLIIDNLLDLTHLTFVHKTTLASSGIQENPLVVTIEGDQVRARREMRNVEPAPIFRTLRHFEGNIDRFQNLAFILPNHVHIRLEACPAGVKDDPDLVHHVVLNHLTPETERTTHYFWSIARRMRIKEPAVTDLLHRLNRTAFEEDAIILRHQQRMVDMTGDGDPPVNLAADEAVNAARRIIRRKLREANQA